MNQISPTTSAVDVQLQFTPNPDTLKYETSMTLVSSGALNFPSRDSAVGKSGLVEELFKELDISAIMLGRTFVTLTLSKQDRLSEINDWAQSTIKTYLESGKPVATISAPAPLRALTEIEQKIVDILDREVRPAVAMDGGDISFEKYEDGFVYLRMQGSCSGCPSSLMTLKMGVETRLKDAIPEIQEVIPV